MQQSSDVMTTPQRKQRRVPKTPPPPPQKKKLHQANPARQDPHPMESYLRWAASLKIPPIDGPPQSPTKSMQAVFNAFRNGHR